MWFPDSKREIQGGWPVCTRGTLKQSLDFDRTAEASVSGPSAVSYAASSRSWRWRWGWRWATHAEGGIVRAAVVKARAQRICVSASINCTPSEKELPHDIDPSHLPQKHPFPDPPQFPTQLPPGVGVGDGVGVGPPPQTWLKSGQLNSHHEKRIKSTSACFLVSCRKKKQAPRPYQSPKLTQAESVEILQGTHKQIRN